MLPVGAQAQAGAASLAHRRKQRCVALQAPHRTRLAQVDVHKLQEVLYLLLCKPILTIFDALRAERRLAGGRVNGAAAATVAGVAASALARPAPQAQQGSSSGGKGPSGDGASSTCAAALVNTVLTSCPGGWGWVPHQENFNHRGWAVVDQLHNLVLGDLVGLQGSSGRARCEGQNRENGRYGAKGADGKRSGWPGQARAARGRAAPPGHGVDLNLCKHPPTHLHCLDEGCQLLTVLEGTSHRLQKRGVGLQQGEVHAEEARREQPWVGGGRAVGWQ